MTEAGQVRLRIDLAYDGSGFSGFARQPDVRTVQGALEGALSRVTGAAVATVVAGRTDAGVHALGQVVHADVPRERAGDPDRLRRALDRLCGPEITVWSVQVVDAGFDARFGAVRRRYRYLLADAVAVAPLWRHDTWHVGPPALDVVAMTRGGAMLLGEHDFSSFCRRAGRQHLRRRVDRCDAVRTDDDRIAVLVEGPAFCHQMVRSIVGCLLPVGRGQRAPEDVTAVLAARDRAAVGQVAPPRGLTLVGVEYLVS